MKKTTLLMVSIVSLLALNGCNDDIKIQNRSFIQLCEISGGRVDLEDTNICHCGKSVEIAEENYIQLSNDDKNKDVDYKKTACAPGVVCVSNGEMCASSGDAPTGKCLDAGKVRCDNDSVNKIGIVSTCSNELLWVNEKCSGTVSCSGIDCGACLNDATKCENNTLYQCSNGAWNENRICAHGCDGNKCLDCAEDETECKDGAIRKCNSSNEWEEMGLCDSGYSCNLDGKTCGVCKNGDKKCFNGITQFCENGQWSEEKACDGDVSCDSSGVECGVCKNGSTRCAEGKIQICQIGHWEDDFVCDSQNSCADLEHCGVCQNGAVQCLNGMTQTCENGAWSEPEKCEGETSCKNEKECGECHNGSTQCESDKMAVCANGVWGDGIDCENESECKNSELCGSCINGDTICENGQIRKCENGEWLEPVACEGEFSCKSDGKSCGECKLGEQKCDNGIMKKCVDGVWDEMPCSESGDVSCVSASECGVCKNGSRRCTNGVVETCQAGNWVELVKCEYSCTPDDGCGECVNWEQRCSNNEFQICKDGQWSEPDICKTSGDEGEEVSCELSGKCGVCKNGDKRCEDSKLGICVNGVWSMTECSGGCNPETKECTLCENSSARCINADDNIGYIELCQDNEWNVNASMKCQISKKGSVSCNGSFVGVYSENDLLLLGSFDNAISTICGKCLNETFYCEKESDGKSYMHKCIGGVGKIESECVKGCSSDFKTCADCNGETEDVCISDGEKSYIKGCKNGALAQKQECMWGCKSNNTECKECEEGKFNCKQLSDNVAVKVKCVDGTYPYNDITIDNYLGDYANYFESCESGVCNSDNTDCGTKCDDAEPGVYYNDTSGICHYKYCSEGRYEIIDSKVGGSCNADFSGFGECRNGWYRLSNSGITNLSTTNCSLTNTRMCLGGLWDEKNNISKVTCVKGCEVNGDMAKCKP